MSLSINKKTVIITSIIFLILSILMMQVVFGADVGNTFSGGGSSSSSSGGYSSGYSSSGGSSFFLFYLLFSLPFPFNVILWVLIIAGIVGGSRSRRNKQQNPNPQNYQSQQPRTAPINENAEIIKIRSTDPDFSKNEFISFAKDVYIRLQEAWEAREWAQIRPFESNELFNLHNKQLQEYIDKDIVLHLDKQEILETQIARFEIDGNYEFITVKLIATLLAYTTDANGKVLEGDPKKRVYREYKLIFKRNKGVTTTSSKGFNTTNCPNCGAPTQVTSSGKCEFCNSIITTGDYGWVLDEYSQWR